MGLYSQLMRITKNVAEPNSMQLFAETCDISHIKKNGPIYVTFLAQIWYVLANIHNFMVLYDITDT